MISSRQEDVQRPLDIDGTRRERVLHGARHRRKRTLVEDKLDVTHGVVYALVTSQLSLNRLDIVFEPVEIGPVTRGEVVDDANSVAALQQGAHEMRSDETRSPGDENPLSHSAIQLRPVRKSTSSTDCLRQGWSHSCDPASICRPPFV